MQPTTRLSYSRPHRGSVPTSMAQGQPSGLLPLTDGCTGPLDVVRTRAAQTSLGRSTPYNFQYELRTGVAHHANAK